VNKEKGPRAVAANVTKYEIFQFIIGDFRAAWYALTTVSRRKNRDKSCSNFMFARQAMNLLEAAALLCSTDLGSRAVPCAGALKDFTDALYAIDPLYLTELPAHAPTPKTSGCRSAVATHVRSSSGASTTWSGTDWRTSTSRPSSN
jgi:hypothetical protein